MPEVQQQGQPGASGGTYKESEAQVEGWRKVRAFIRQQGIGVDDTFLVKGTIAKILLDTGDHYFTKPQTNDNGETKDWAYVKVLAAITDPRFGPPGTLDFPAKNVGASFFDGVTKKGRSPNRGGMYNLHVAVTGQEPSQALRDGQSSWDTEDYENKPILLRLVFLGKEEPDSQYADRRAGMKIFINGFEKDRDVHKAAVDWGDDDDDSAGPPWSAREGNAHPTPTEKVVNEVLGAKAKEAAAAADLSKFPATERQVAFIYALGRECGLDKDGVRMWSDELFSNPPEQITRRDASSLIDALQRWRYEEDPKLAAHPGNVDPRKDEGKDEVVAVGVSTKPAKPPTEDDEDLNFD